ncbi:hypothetical protein GWC95_05965 [Sediminibacterium roseum]|uniref:Phage tail collar domain-containing protein n=1 Tax=Sediminibacterium roseum TaxID=1978412 RepID=A0ABW9ZWP5_9BACT|nr:tail fiber protein [Sediminibacterium roseum]NCI49460.1 hypothetical protein [Sediminibacterium roseum]
MEAYVGTIMLWPCNWVPDGWLACSGQTLTVNGNQALFSLIGAIYGGDGTSTFKLPNLNGRVAVGVDNTTQFQFGKSGGNANNPVSFSGMGVGSVTLNASQMPQHSHAVPSLPMMVNLPAYAGGDADQSAPQTTSVFGVGNYTDGVVNYPVNVYSSNTPDTTISAKGTTSSGGVTGSAGNGQPVVMPVDLSKAGGVSTAVQPWAALTYIICLVGYYPPRP